MAQGQWSRRHGQPGRLTTPASTWPLNSVCQGRSGNGAGSRVALHRAAGPGAQQPHSSWMAQFAVCAPNSSCSMFKHRWMCWPLNAARAVPSLCRNTGGRSRGDKLPLRLPPSYRCRRARGPTSCPQSNRAASPTERKCHKCVGVVQHRCRHVTESPSIEPRGAGRDHCSPIRFFARLLPASRPCLNCVNSDILAPTSWREIRAHERPGDTDARLMLSCTCARAHAQTDTDAEEENKCARDGARGTLDGTFDGKPVTSARAIRNHTQATCHHRRALPKVCKGTNRGPRTCTSITKHSNDCATECMRRGKSPLVTA
jgi:hypothetical protein